jgi:hypothetical protein
VAEILTEFSAPKGFAPIERIPILGRTGPDLTTNELGLVVDVKSRLAVPKHILPEKGFMYWSLDGLVYIRLDDLYKATCHDLSVYIVPPSVQVGRWFNHMDEWRREKMPSGFAALVLHRPGMDVKDSAFVMRNEERGELWSIMR